MYNREEIIDEGLNIIENNLVNDETIVFYDFCIKARIKVTPVTEALAAAQGNPGLLAFTNHNIFFVQRSGIIKPTYELAIKIPLEKVAHLDTSGLVMKSLKITVSSGEGEACIFLNFKSVKDKDKKIENIMAELEEIIQKNIKAESVGSQELGITVCEYCGEKNAKTNEKCVKCGAILKK